MESFMLDDAKLSKIIANAKKEQAKAIAKVFGSVVKAIKHVMGYVGRFFTVVQNCREIEVDFNYLNQADKLRDRVFTDPRLFF